jgi:hypothetical protein
VRAGWIVALSLALVLCARTTNRESCTVDEFGNLPLTVAYRDADAWHIDPGNPPLTRWLQGIPFVAKPPVLGATPAELDAIETSWDLGYRFERVHGDDYHTLLVRARWVSVALFLLTVLGVYVWTREFGAWPATMAALLAASCPNLLAHGRLVTPDIGLACFVTWSAWAVARIHGTDSPARAACAGVLTALAILAKLSGLLLPIVYVVYLAADVPGSMLARARRVAIFGGVLFLSPYAFYGFPAPGTWNGWPTFLPEPLVRGVLAQLAEPPYPAYLLGENRVGGWNWYYAVALLVKVPLSTIALVGIAKVVMLYEKRVAFPWALAASFFIVFGWGTDKNIGVRYLLPLFPLLFVFVAPLFASDDRRLQRTAFVLAGVSSLSGVAASAAPLAYFNGLERFAGEKRDILVDSNLDWGQALPDLADWMKRENVETIRLAYFGRIDPDVYGIRWRTLPSEPVDGPIAISATCLAGRPYLVRWKERPQMEPTFAWSREDTWSWLRGLEPDEELGGGAILVWKDAASARRR